MEYLVPSINYNIKANQNYFEASYIPPKVPKIDVPSNVSKMDVLLSVVDVEYKATTVTSTNKLGAKKTVQKTSQQYVNDLRGYNKKLLTQLMLMPNSSLLDIKSLADNVNDLKLAEKIIKLHNSYLRKLIRELEIANKRNKK